MIPLIVIRPQPGCDASVAAARARGLDAHGFPLFAVRALDWQPPAPGVSLFSPRPGLHATGPQIHARMQHGDDADLPISFKLIFLNIQSKTHPPQIL